MRTNKQQTAEVFTILSMVCIIIAFISAIFAQNYVVFGAGLAVAFISVAVATVLNPSHE